MLSFWVSAVAGTKSALAIADGLTSAIVSRNRASGTIASTERMNSSVMRGGNQFRGHQRYWHKGQQPKYGIMAELFEQRIHAHLWI